MSVERMPSVPGRASGVAAYTKLDPSYPGYINATREGDKVTVMLRGDARDDGREGPMARLSLTLSEWQKFLSEVQYRL